MQNTRLRTDRSNIGGEQPEPADVPLLSAKRAARLLDRSESFLEKDRRRLRRGEKGHIAFIQSGRRVLYRRIDLENWIAAHVVRGPGGGR